MANPIYFLVAHKPYETNRIPINGQVSHNDISFIDIETLFYTRNEYLKAKNLEEKDLFIVRIKDDNIHIYPCFFRIDSELSVYQKINDSMLLFANERQERKLQGQTVELQKGPVFQEYTRMLLNNITSDTQKKNVITKENNFLKPEELKRKIKKISTKRDFARELPKIQEFLVHYKTLRTLTLSYVNYAFPGFIEDQSESQKLVYEYFRSKTT